MGPGRVRDDDLLKSLAGPQSPCVGKVYSYDPKLTAHLLLSPSKRPDHPRAVAISPRRTLQCSQHIPNANRHCLMTVPPGKERLEHDCSPCYLHMVVSASHRRAKDGHKVTMGSFDDDLRIYQNRAGLSMLRLREAELPRPDSTSLILNSIKLRPESQEGRVEVRGEGRAPFHTTRRSATS